MANVKENQLIALFNNDVLYDCYCSVEDNFVLVSSSVVDITFKKQGGHMEMSVDRLIGADEEEQFCYLRLMAFILRNYKVIESLVLDVLTH